jgi:hypothetical protein
MPVIMKGEKRPAPPTGHAAAQMQMTRDTRRAKMKERTRDAEVRLEFGACVGRKGDDG